MVHSTYDTSESGLRGSILPLSQSSELGSGPMFQSAILRGHGTGTRPIDVGLVAETLLFYQNVHLVADRGLLVGMLRAVGPDNFVQLLHDKRITMTYSRSNPCVLTNSPHGVPVHVFAAYSVHGQKKRLRNRQEVEQTIEMELGKSLTTKRIADKVLRSTLFKHAPPQTSEEIGDATKECFPDVAYTTQAARGLLGVLAPKYRIPPDFRFQVSLAEDNNFLVWSNLDYDAANAAFRAHTGSTESPITDAYLTSFFLNANVDMRLSAAYMAELVGSDATSTLLRLRFQHLLARRERNVKQITLFQEIHLKNATAIREAINSGERSFDQFLHILDKADKFKHWLADINPDSNILSDYYEAATRDDWINRLPVKGLRWVVANAVGFASFIPAVAAMGPVGATIPGLLASAADEFWVEL